MVVSELYRGVYWVLRGSVGWSCGSCELTDNTVELMWLSAVTPRMTVCGDYLINDGIIADLARCGPHGDLPWPIKMIGTRRLLSLDLVRKPRILRAHGMMVPQIQPGLCARRLTYVLCTRCI